MDDEWNSSGGGWNGNAAAPSWNGQSNDARNKSGNGEWSEGPNKSSFHGGDHEGGDHQEGGGGGGSGGGGCFNCGDTGHMKAECPNPRVFNGTCNGCGEQGHQARDCPSKPKICHNCNENGHTAGDCKNNRHLDRSKVPDMSPDAAWDMIEQASKEVDIDDFKEGFEALCKASPDLTYREIEVECRNRGLKIYLIGLKKDVHASLTNVNLQGKIGQTYTVGYFISPDCQRPAMIPIWPKDADDNLARLDDAGEPLPSHVMLCRSCGKPGHAKADCTEAEVHEPIKVMCALCNEEGHRVRDCTNRPVREPKTCKICGSEDHIAKDCDQKPPPMVCRNCQQEGHKAAECDQPRVIRCFNCEGEHHAKECPKPKDWSKVTCKHCGETGHASATRCKVPPKDGAGNGDLGNGNNDSSGGGIHNDNTAVGGDDWNTGGENNAGGGNNNWETPQAISAW